jgi:hypothetical protein
MILGGCSGEPVAPRSGVDYRVEGVLVKNLSDGSARIDLTLTKDSTAYKKAVITLGTTVLDTNVYGYSKTFSSSAIAVGQTYSLNIHDSTSLNVNLTISMPGTFSITGISPASRIYTSDPVYVTWSVATNADGYILASVPPSGAVTDSGYSVYDYTVADPGMIPTTGFRYNGIAISGTHKVYVAAFTGAPAKTIGFPFLIPALDGPDDNVSKSIIFGRMAGMVLAVPDSIIVP